MLSRLLKVGVVVLAVAVWSMLPGCPAPGSDNGDVGGDPVDDGGVVDEPVDDGGNGGDDGDDGGNPSGKTVVFSDPNGEFKTDEVNDVEGEIVQFDAETFAIIWAEDGTRFDEGLWTVNGNLLAGGGFQVRFGSEGGVRKAYFTETIPATICDIEISSGFLSIFSTSVTVPQD